MSINGPDPDWSAWHAAYDDPGSPLAVRLKIVQRRIADALGAAPPGPIRVISMCAGQGRDILGVLPYEGAVPANLVLACGIFGNVDEPSTRSTITLLPTLCAPGATVIWTRHRKEPDLTPAIRGWFRDCGFDEVGFDAPDGFFLSVGTNRYAGPPAPFEAGRRMFTFVSG